MARRGAAGNENAWRRLGEEVKFLIRIITAMLNDPEYRSILTKEDMAKLSQAYDRVVAFQYKAESLMFRKGPEKGRAADVFSGYSEKRYDEALSAIRKMAVEQAEITKAGGMEINPEEI